MSKPRNNNLMSRCSVAVAAGATISGWARENQIPRRTVAGWARLPEFKALVEKHRARIIDRAIGRMTKHLVRAVEEIARIATKGEGDAVRLSASKALVEKLIDVATHAAIQRRYDELTARVLALETHAHEDGESEAN